MICNYSNIELKKGGVYQIRNLLNNNIYIGSAKKFEQRKIGHLKNLKRGNHHSIHLQRAFNKYGNENFIFEIIEIIDDISQLFNKEQIYLNNLKPQYNISTQAYGSNGRLGMKNSDSHREKNRIWMKKNYHTVITNEVRKKMSKRRMGKDPWNKGTKGIMKAWNKGKKLSPEHGKNCTQKAHESLQKKVYLYDITKNCCTEFKSIQHCKYFLKSPSIQYYVGTFKIFKDKYVILFENMDIEKVKQKSIKVGKSKAITLKDENGNVLNFKSLTEAFKFYNCSSTKIYTMLRKTKSNAEE